MRSFVREAYFWVGWLVLFGVNTAVAQPGRVEDAPSPGTYESYFRWDFNASGFYSKRGVDLAGMRYSHWLPTDRFPKNYLGLEWQVLLKPTSGLRNFFNPLPLREWDINPHIEFDFNPWEVFLPSYYRGPINVPGRKPGPRKYVPDRTVNWRVIPPDAPAVDLNSKGLDFNFGDNTIRMKLVFYDLWFRFEPEGREDSHLRIGHFLIPYGVNPMLGYRGGGFILPVENTDLGFKYDWGVVWKDLLAGYEYMLALTTGMGLGIHDPHWFASDKPASFLVSGRFGLPNYRRFNYGLSWLYGQTPTVIGDHMLVDYAIRKWRVNLDASYRHRTYTTFSAEMAYGVNQDAQGDADKEDEHVITNMITIDYVPRRFQKFSFTLQAQSVLFDVLESRHNLVNITFETGFSLTNALTLRLAYVHDFLQPVMVAETDDRVYFSVSYYR